MIVAAITTVSALDSSSRRCSTWALCLTSRRCADKSVSYLALQLGVSSEVLQQYGDREHVRTDHLQEIQDRLGFHDAGQHEPAVLSAWLLDRALEHDRPIVLFHLACQWLLQERLVRPGVTRIERLVATIRERAQQETYRRLGTLLTPTLRAGLDALLQPLSTTGRTWLSWLQREATALTPRAILDEIEKLNYVRALGADTWQLDSLTSNRRKLLAGIGRRSTNQALQRMSPERRVADPDGVPRTGRGRRYRRDHRPFRSSLDELVRLSAS